MALSTGCPGFEAIGSGPVADGGTSSSGSGDVDPSTTLGTTDSDAGTTSVASTTDPTQPTKTTSTGSGDDGTASTPTSDDSSGTTSTIASDTNMPSTDTSDSESDTNGKCQQIDVEPNDAEAQDEFVVLGTQGCDFLPATAEGTLLDADDRDIFNYDSPWTCGDQQMPAHNVRTASSDVELCVFPRCVAKGGETITCSEGSFEIVKGFSGCCSDVEAEARIECLSLNGSQDTFAFISVASDTAQCLDYSFEYAVFAL